METTTEKKFLLERDGFVLKSKGGDTSQRWYFEYYKEYDFGFRKRVKAYGGINRHSNPDRRFYAAKLFLDRLVSGEYGKKFEAVRLHAVFNRYHGEHTKGLRDKTKTTYLTKINHFIDYCEQRRVDDITGITKTFCSKYLDSITRSNTTVNSYCNTLGTYFSLFAADRLIKENPFDSIKKLPEARRGKFPFSVSQMEKLKGPVLAASPELWMACRLLFYCFIRPAEIRLLRVEDVNLDDGFITIHGSISKNKKTQIVTVPRAFYSELKQWVGAAPPNFYVVNLSCNKLSRDWLNKTHRGILQGMGFSSRYSLYSWKHSGAVRAVKSGINLKDLQLQMRHHSLDQLDEYLREMGVMESADLKNNFPGI